MNSHQTSSASLHPPVAAGVSTGGESRGIFDSTDMNTTEEREREMFLGGCEAALRAYRKWAAKVEGLDPWPCYIEGQVLKIDQGEGKPLYEIAINRADTPEKIIAWVSHLTEKTWMDRTRIKAFVRTACLASGIEDRAEI